MPALDRHDRTAFDISLYAENATAEGDLPAKIVSIGGLNDAEACAHIRQDGIDVLVDLWGHTSGGRLGVFARRAAPVQVAWINYLQSTGLTAMDYVLHADSMRTPDIEDFFVERIWSLGPTNARSARPARRRKAPRPPFTTDSRVSPASIIPRKSAINASPPGRAY
jgi:predicted O-linked N-acetylglucosamine transferase (SPINDLY family)